MRGKFTDYIVFVLLAIAPAFFMLTRSLAEEEDSKVPPKGSAQFQELPFNFADSFKIGELKGLSGMLVFSATINNYDRILVLDLDAARIRKVIDGPGNNSYPSFSPDGHKLVFTSDRDGNKEIYASDWDGTNQLRLTKTAADNDNPSWSFDQKKIVFYSETSPSGKDTNLQVIDRQNLNPSQITRFKGRNTVPRWAPDGKSIVYSTNRFWPGWDVCVWHIAEKMETCPLTGAASYCRARYSRAGRFLAYSSGAFEDIDISILDLSTNTSQSITNLPGREYDAAWSPTDRQLVFAAENGQSGLFNLYLVDIKSKERKVVPLVTAPYSLRFPDWASSTTFDLEASRQRDEQVNERWEFENSTAPSETAETSTTPLASPTEAPATPAPTAGAALPPAQ